MDVIYKLHDLFHKFEGENKQSTHHNIMSSLQTRKKSVLKAPPISKNKHNDDDTNITVDPETGFEDLDAFWDKVRSPTGYTPEPPNAKLKKKKEDSNNNAKQKDAVTPANRRPIHRPFSDQSKSSSNTTKFTTHSSMSSFITNIARQKLGKNKSSPNHQDDDLFSPSAISTVSTAPPSSVKKDDILDTPVTAKSTKSKSNPTYTPLAEKTPEPQQLQLSSLQKKKTPLSSSSKRMEEKSTPESTADSPPALPLPFTQETEEDSSSEPVQPLEQSIEELLNTTAKDFSEDTSTPSKVEADDHNANTNLDAQDELEFDGDDGDGDETEEEFSSRQKSQKAPLRRVEEKETLETSEKEEEDEDEEEEDMGIGHDFHNEDNNDDELPPAEDDDDNMQGYDDDDHDDDDKEGSGFQLSDPSPSPPSKKKKEQQQPLSPVISPTSSPPAHPPHSSPDFDTHEDNDVDDLSREGKDDNQFNAEPSIKQKQTKKRTKQKSNKKKTPVTASDSSEPSSESEAISKKEPKKRKPAKVTPSARHKSSFKTGIPGPREYETINASEFKEYGDDNEDDSSVEESDFRRSKRARFPPLQFWKNEKLVYKANNYHDSEVLGDMPVVRAVVKALPTPYKHIDRVRRNAINNRPNTKASKYEKSKKSSNNSQNSLPKFNDAEIRRKHDIIDGDVADIWDESLEGINQRKLVCHASKMVSSTLPITRQRDPSESRVVGSASQAFNIPEAGDIIPGWISGHLILPPGGIKDAEGVGLCSQVFSVQTCQPNSLEVSLADPEDNEYDSDTAQRFLLSPGDFFHVPPNNVYRIENHSKEADGKLFFTIIRPMTSK